MAEVNPQIDTDRNDNDAADKWAALLRDATRQQKLEALQLLLDREADINITDKDGTAPLHIASIIGCPEIVENLLNRGAWVNLADCNNSTPLYYATENRHERTVKVLLEHGAKFDPKDSTLVHTAIKNGSYLVLDHFLKTYPEMISTNYNNRTLLHTAVSELQLEVVKVLLDHGADINAKDKQGETPIFHAIGGLPLCYRPNKKNQLPIFQLLLSRGADINASDAYHRPLLHRTIEEGSEEMVLLLLKNHVAVNTEDYQTALISAVDRGLVNIARYLLVHGACINFVCTDRSYPGYTPLHFACQHNSEELCKLLIDHGADVNACIEDYGKPIRVAIQHSNTNIVKLLLKHGTQLEAIGDLETIFPSVHHSNNVSIIALILQNCPEVISLLDVEGCTPLHNAAGKKRLEAANLFLKHNANVAALDHKGQTPLFYAVLMNRDKEYPANAKMVRLLISRGANVNVADKDGSTPLHVSVQQGCSESSKVLLDSGARVTTARTKDGKTALHFAKMREVARILLKHDADVDARDKDGHTALHIASNQHYPDVVSLLLENGSDVNITNADGETPLSLAVNPRFLVSHGHSMQSSIHARQTIRTLGEHICRMRALNLYVKDKNRVTSMDNARFYRQCEAEVAEMREKNISNTDVSFYSLLTNQKGIYCENDFSDRNTSIARALKLGNYKLKFPLYSNMIEQCFNRAQKRKVLLYRASNSLNFLSKCILPEELFEEIFQYLSNSDVKNLIYATPDNHK